MILLTNHQQGKKKNSRMVGRYKSLLGRNLHKQYKECIINNCSYHLTSTALLGSANETDNLATQNIQQNHMCTSCSDNSLEPRLFLPLNCTALTLPSYYYQKGRGSWAFHHTLACLFQMLLVFWWCPLLVQPMLAAQRKSSVVVHSGILGKMHQARCLYFHQQMVFSVMKLQVLLSVSLKMSNRVSSDMVNPFLSFLFTNPLLLPRN